MLKPSLLSREQWIKNWLDTVIDKPLKNLVEDIEQRIENSLVLCRLHELWNHNYKHSSPDLGKFEWCKQEKKSQNLDFKAASAWIFLILIM